MPQVIHGNGASVKTYNALRAPMPEKWLALDESERIALVAAYHARKKVDGANAESPAIIHTVVENQVAAGQPATVRSTLARLMKESLDRHDAVHAIGMLECQQIFSVIDTHQHYGEERYIRDLKALTVSSHRQACEEPEREDDTFPVMADDDRFLVGWKEFEGTDFEDEDALR